MPPLLSPPMFAASLPLAAPGRGWRARRNAAAAADGGGGVGGGSGASDLGPAAAAVAADVREARGALPC